MGQRVLQNGAVGDRDRSVQDAVGQIGGRAHRDAAMHPIAVSEALVLRGTGQCVEHHPVGHQQGIGCLAVPPPVLALLTHRQAAVAVQQSGDQALFVVLRRAEILHDRPRAGTERRIVSAARRSSGARRGSTDACSGRTVSTSPAKSAGSSPATGCETGNPRDGGTGPTPAPAPPRAARSGEGRAR